MDRLAYWLVFISLLFHFHVSISVENEVKESLIKFLENLSPSNNDIAEFGWNMSSDPCDGQWKGVVCNTKSTAVRKIILDNLELTGILDAKSLCSVQSISVLSLNNNSLTGEIPEEIVNCNQLTHFYVSGNRFFGSLPDSFSRLSNLKRLVINNNNFSGRLPDLPRISGLITFLAQDNQFSGEIPMFNFFNLQQFNASFNNFSGPVPDLEGHFDTSSIIGNPGLCGDPLPNSCPPIKGKSNRVSVERALMYSGYVVAGLIFVAFVAFVFLKRKKRNVVKRGASSNKRNTGVSSDNKSSTSRSEFSLTSAESGFVSTSLTVLSSPVAVSLRFEDLLKAPAELLGRGKHGSLYKVTLDNNTMLTVKRIKDWAISGEDFKKRMAKIDKVKHLNVLPAIAFYCSKEEKLLVYEYQQNGSLLRLLQGPTFGWNSRLCVAASIADALAFMHEEFFDDKIGHGNLKSSNILFNKNMEPCISEYGLMVVSNQDIPPIINSKTRFSRTFHVDIYAFGVILLELLTGKVVLGNGSELVQWVQSVVREEWTAEVFDKALTLNDASEERMMELLQVALNCINPSPEDRPNMGEVARIINSIKEEGERSIISEPEK